MCSEIQDNSQILDLIIVGGGINGTGIAADASGRGLSVGLYEKLDFSSQNASPDPIFFYSDLCHRPPYQFSCISETIDEHKALLKNAPHIVKAMRCCLPLHSFSRATWVIRMGFFIYDHLLKRSPLAPNQQVDLAETGLFPKELATGFEYSDAVVDGARLVLLNAISAKQNGAEINNYCRVVKAERVANLWNITVLNTQTNIRFQRKARALVNTTGLSNSQLLDDALADDTQAEFNEDWLYIKPFFDTSEARLNSNLVKKIHIIVPRLHHQQKAYRLENGDKQSVFVTPYLNDFSIISCTDVEYVGDPLQGTLSNGEINYLLNVVNQHFIKQLKADDIVKSYNTVQPPYAPEVSPSQATTKDYSLALEQPQNQAPLVSIFGGRLITYRYRAESVMQLVSPYFERLGGSWTAAATLPGGDFNYPCKQLANNLVTQHSWLPINTANRYVSQFGALAWKLLEGCDSEADFGPHFGAGLYRREIDYCIENEFAKTAEDILWHRTKLGLYLSQEQQANVALYMQTHTSMGIAQVS